MKRQPEPPADDMLNFKYIHAGNVEVKCPIPMNLELMLAQRGAPDNFIQPREPAAVEYDQLEHFLGVGAGLQFILDLLRAELSRNPQAREVGLLQEVFPVRFNQLGVIPGAGQLEKIKILSNLKVVHAIDIAWKLSLHIRFNAPQLTSIIVLYPLQEVDQVLSLDRNKPAAIEFRQDHNAVPLGAQPISTPRSDSRRLEL